MWETPHMTNNDRFNSFVFQCVVCNEMTNAAHHALTDSVRQQPEFRSQLSKLEISPSQTQLKSKQSWQIIWSATWYIDCGHNFY